MLTSNILRILQNHNIRQFKNILCQRQTWIYSIRTYGNKEFKNILCQRQTKSLFKIRVIKYLNSKTSYVNVKLICFSCTCMMFNYSKTSYVNVKHGNGIEEFQKLLEFKNILCQRQTSCKCYILIKYT